MWELVLVDFDDTLVETAPAFQQAREALFERLEAEGFPRAEAERFHHEVVEPELLAVFGMGPFRLEPSFRETYVRLCVQAGRPPDPRTAEECAALGRDFMGHPVLLEGALEALEVLARRHPTVLYSQASHPEYQMGRIRDAGVPRVLPEERIHISPGKSPADYLRTIRKFGATSAARTVMVGNSIRSDVNPALEAGARAILVEPYEMWVYDRVEPVRNDFLRFTTFPEAVRHLLADGRAG